MKKYSVYMEFVRLYKEMMRIYREAWRNKEMSDDEWDVVHARIWHYLYRLETLMFTIRSKKYEWMYEDIAVTMWENSYSREAYLCKQPLIVKS